MIPITRPWLGPEEGRAAAAVIESGWLAQGAKVSEFEQALCKITGAEYGVAVSSCTTGLHLALLIHGVGPAFHTPPTVLHYEEPSVDTVIEEGMTFTIEPMITLGTIDYDIWADDWTVTTKDKKWTAQFEHTLVVTAEGSEILTLP